jgi:glutamate 5-kinase
MNFFEHLDSEFAYSKEAFFYTINRLPESIIVVINIGIGSLSYNTGLLNIRSFKNFIADISEFVNISSKRRVIIVVSDSIEKTRHLYMKNEDSISANSGLYSALIALTHNDIVNLFCDGFANYNLRAIGFSITAAGADASGELNKMLKTIESVIFSNSKDDEVKIRAVKELLKSKKNIAQTSRYNIMVKKTAETLKGLFKHFPRTIPIIMEDISQKENQIEEDDGFAAKIAMAVNADVVVSISRKGMLYTVDPLKNDNALPFYCYDTSRKEPFDDARRAVLSKKLNAAAHVNSYSRPIPLILTSFNKPYTISNMFDKNTIDNIVQKGEFPRFTLFINSRKILKFSTDTSLPIEDRHISGAIIIDDNAEKALIHDKKSLLSVGIIKVQGDFESKSVVAILNKKLEDIGRGVVNYNNFEIQQVIKEGNTLVIISRDKMRLKKSIINET